MEIFNHPESLETLKEMYNESVKKEHQCTTEKFKTLLTKRAFNDESTKTGMLIIHRRESGSIKPLSLTWTEKPPIREIRPEKQILVEYHHKTSKKMVVVNGEFSAFPIAKERFELPKKTLTAMRRLQPVEEWEQKWIQNL